MKTCAVCFLASGNDPDTCPDCGNASWSVVTIEPKKAPKQSIPPKKAAAPSEPKGDD